MVKRIALFSLFLFLMVNFGHGTLLQLINIERLIESADQIYYGSVLSNREEKGTAQGLYPATVTTILVKKGYKNAKAGEKVEIWQLAIRPGSKGKLQLFYSLPRFSPGEEATFFVSAKNRRGLQSTIGLGQGVFRVQKGCKLFEKCLVRNDTGNKDLFRNIKNAHLTTVLSQLNLKSDAGQAIVSPLNLGALEKIILTQMSKAGL